MSRIRALLQRASWLEEPGSSQRIVGADGSHRQPESAGGLVDIPDDPVTVSVASRLVYHTDPHNAAADRFRMVRLRLQALWNAGKLKKVLITSPLPGDGKSMVAINLVTALAERGKRAVLLIEADLHHSCLTKRLGLSPKPGLGECLESGSDPLSVIRRLTPLEWYLLPAGRPSGNATELLQGQRLPAVIDRLAPHFDWMVIDSPPVIPISDVLSLKNCTEGTLLVVRAGRTSQDAVEETIALLGKQHVLGVILNAMKPSDLVYRKYGYEY